jgi:hypothetical protein
VRRVQAFPYARSCAAPGAEYFEKVMASLRKEVRKLEEEELFERTLRPDAPCIGEQTAPSGDVDSIMASLMGPEPGSELRPAVSADAGVASALRNHGLFGEEDSTPTEADPIMARGKGKGRAR